MERQIHLGVTAWDLNLAARPAEPEESARTRKPGRVALALLCALMVIFAATLRVAHSHTATEQESGHCPICVAIHTGIPTATLAVSVILHAAPEPVDTIAPKAPARPRVETLSDRAPPALA
ncbi:MAG TPA: hypothetical protein VGT04_13620 [Acidobacteriaceae bacterium]|nr:hypothetical protein [Acidobacteriaceae bacterium]